MIKITDCGNPNYVKVTGDNELCVCLCEKTCENNISLKNLKELYPNVKISIRKEQLEN